MTAPANSIEPEQHIEELRVEMERISDSRLIMLALSRMMNPAEVDHESQAVKREIQRRVEIDKRIL